MTLWDHSLRELLEKGGAVMWPLLGCSILATALVFDRMVALVRARLDFDGFLSRLEGLVRSGRTAAALDLSSGRSPIARAAAAFLANLHLSDDERASVVAREGALALEGIERRVRGLSTIAQVAMLLGLLGTVAGLVSAFHQIELHAGSVQPGDLAQGIWEALLTTVFGLAIAIPSFLASHWFESRIEAIARRMSFVVSYLDEWRRTPASPSSAGSGVKHGESPAPVGLAHSPAAAKSKETAR